MLWALTNNRKSREGGGREIGEILTKGGGGKRWGNINKKGRREKEMSDKGGEEIEKEID